MLFKIANNNIFLSRYLGSVSVNSSDAGDRILWLWGVNTMPADALAPKVARASAGMALAA